MDDLKQMEMAKWMDTVAKQGVIERESRDIESRLRDLERQHVWTVLAN